MYIDCSAPDELTGHPFTKKKMILCQHCHCLDGVFVLVGSIKTIEECIVNILTFVIHLFHGYIASTKSILECGLLHM
jgi:hypothetical protein